MNRDICFVANAVQGRGGQGEFLRAMALALRRFDSPTIYSRACNEPGINCIDISTKTLRSAISTCLGRVPVLRARTDWKVLLSDLDFDLQVSRRIASPMLLEGVMGQCCLAFMEARRQGAQTCLVLAALNTHIEFMARAVSAERRRLGIHGNGSIHRKMVSRVKKELAMADWVRVPSELAKRSFVDAGVPERKVHVARLPIDLNHFKPVRQEDDTFRVLSVSSIEPRKGVHVLLEAFERARIPNSELVLIGGTGDRWSRSCLEGYLRRNSNIRQQFIDVGKAPVRQHYGAATVLVHAALEDGYGLVVPQAMACGRPVVVTNCTGASELVTHGVNGCVVPAGGVAELADTLSALAANRDVTLAMGRAATAAVVELSYDGYAHEIEKFYSMALGARYA